MIARNNRIATTPVSRDKLIASHSYVRGNRDAKVSLVEFGDFQCPACAAAYPILEQLLALYKDNPDVNFVFRNFPLPQHQFALLSAESAEAAGAQGKYWEMYDLLYKNQNAWTGSSDPLSIFLEYANQLKLDVNRFKDDVKQSKYAESISDDQQQGLALGINSTPTFFLNGTRMVGIQNFEDLKARVDAELSK